MRLIRRPVPRLHRPELVRPQNQPGRSIAWVKTRDVRWDSDLDRKVAILARLCPFFKTILESCVQYE